MQSGILTVTGEGYTHILLDGFPRHVTVKFVDIDPIPCNPHHHHHEKDYLFYEIEKVDEDPKKHHEPGHIHHDRQFFLFIEWEVTGVREIYWQAHITKLG
jgi:hypothetical protein